MMFRSQVGSRVRVRAKRAWVPTAEGLEGRALLAASAAGVHAGAAVVRPALGQIATTLTLTGPANPVTVGQTIPYTALVGIASGTTPPTGTVTFSINGVALPAVPVNSNGFANINLPAQTAGSHPVSASYSGNFLYAPSQRSTTQQVNKAVTAAVLAVNPAFPTANQNVFAAVQLSVPSGNAAPPTYTGSVNFFDNGVLLQTLPVSPSGFAQLTRRFTQGGHSLRASYTGDANFLAANSNVVSFTVQPGQLRQGQGTPATVVAVQRFGIHYQPTVLRITFSGPMDPLRAQIGANYLIVGPAGGVIPVTAAVYDAATHSVTLYPSRRLDLHYTYALKVNATGPFGLTDASGVPLDGSGLGRPGTDYLTFLTAQNLAAPCFFPFSPWVCLPPRRWCV